MRLIFDLEANGLLLPEPGKKAATRVWCVAAKDIDNGDEYLWKLDEMILREAFNFLNQVDLLIGHNILGYDIPLIWKLYGIGIGAQTCDTQVLSYLYNPDRGGHSVEWWAEYLGGEKKVQHEDWDNFSEDMVERCVSDVRLTEKIYYALMEERKV